MFHIDLNVLLLFILVSESHVTTKDCETMAGEYFLSGVMNEPCHFISNFSETFVVISKPKCSSVLELVVLLIRSN